MTILETFHFFPSLPSELRLKIWGLVVLEPRTVDIGCNKAMLDTRHRYAEHFTSSTPPPPAIHVCRESRYEALAVYTPSFKTSKFSGFWTELDEPITKTTKDVRYTYVNWENDTIRCLDNLLEYLGKEESNSIQRLEVKVQDTGYFGHFHMDNIKHMGALKTLTLFVKETVTNSWDNLDRHIRLLQQDFEFGKGENPGWECPDVIFLGIDTSRVYSIFQGGALVPGWKAGDKYPDELVEQT